MISRGNICFWRRRSVVFLMTVRVCNQYQRAVVYFLGRYARTSGPGVYFMLPFLEWRSLVDVRTTTTAVAQQETITKDNVPVKINAVIWRRVVSPSDSLIEVADVEDAVTQAAVTALRATIGRHTLDDVLKDQETVSAQLKAGLDAITHPWGVKVEQVQMKNIEIPASMQRAMAQEAEALREKTLAGHQGRGRARGRPDAARGRRHHRVLARFAGAAPHADVDRGRRRAEHDDHRHDAERVRHAGGRLGEERAVKVSARRATPDGGRDALKGVVVCSDGSR